MHAESPIAWVLRWRQGLRNPHVIVCLLVFRVGFRRDITHPPDRPRGMFAPHHRAPGPDSGLVSSLADISKLSRAAKKPDAAPDGEAPLIERSLRTLKQGLFGVLFVMAKSSSSPPIWQFTIVVAHFVQLLSFPLSASPNFPWRTQPSVYWLSLLLEATSLTQRVMANQLMRTIACFLACSWICGLLACALWVGRAFIQENFVVLWPITLLRGVATLSTTVGFIPLVSAALQVYVCDGEATWGATSLKCFTGAHLLFCILTALLLTAFVPFALIVVMCFFDRDPKSSNHLATPHSRVETVMVIIKAVLTLVFTLEAVFRGTIMVLVMGVCAIVQLFVYLHYLPFYSNAANQLFVVCAALFAWATACLILAYIRVTSTDGFEGFLFLTGLPTVTFSGYALAKSRIRAFNEDILLTSVYMVEMKARCMLTGMAAELPRDAQRFVYRHGPSDRSSNDAPSDEAESERQLQILKDVDSLYGAALEHFSDSAMLHVFVAQYLNLYRANRHLELVHIAAAETKDPSIDVTFLVYQRRQQIRQEDASDKGSMSLLASIKFEQAKADSEEQGLKARGLQAEFWKELASVQPSLSKLDSLGWEYDEATRKADTAFKLMLDLNPKAVSVIRRYSQFLVEVSNKSFHAQKLAMQADVMEEEAESALVSSVDDTVVLLAQGPPLDGSRDDTAIVHVSQVESTLGRIESINPAAIKLFGYSRIEAVGKDVSKLIAAPIAGFYKEQMHEYLTSGDEKPLLPSRVVIGEHSSGFGFPLQVSVKPLEDTFAVIAHSIQCKGQYILASTQGYHVISGSEESLAMMGVQPEDVEARRVCLLEYFDEAMLDELVYEGDSIDPTAHGQVIPRRMVSVRNVSKAYLEANSGDSGTFAFSKKKHGSVSSAGGDVLAAAVGKTFSIWMRLQTTRLVNVERTVFQAPGFAGAFRRSDSAGTSNPDPPETDELDDSGDGETDERDADRIILITWSQVKESEKTTNEVARKSALLKQSARRQNLSGVGLGSGGSDVTGNLRSSRLSGIGPTSFETTASGRDGLATVAVDVKRRRSIVRFDAPAVVEADASPVLPTAIPAAVVPLPSYATPIALYGEVSRNELKLDAPPPAKDSSISTQSLQFDCGLDEDALKQHNANSRSAKVLPVDVAPKDEESHSVGTRNSTTSVARFHLALEHGDVMEEGNLRFLRRALLLVTIVCVGLGAAAYATVNALQSANTKQMELVQAEAIRMASVKRVFTEVLQVQLTANGTNANTAFSEEFSQLAQDVGVLASTHNQLSVVNPPQTPDHVALFTSTPFLMTQLDAGQFVTTSSTLSDVLAEYIASAEQLLSYNVARFGVGVSDPYISYVLSNGETVFQGLNQSVHLRFDARTIVTQTLRTQVDVLSLITGGFIVLVIVALILPVSLRIGNDKHRMFSLFMQVPLTVISRLWARCQQVYDMRRVQRNIEAEGADSIDGESKTNGPRDQQVGGIDWRDVDFSKSSGRELKRDFRWPLMLFMKLSWPLVFAAGLFVGFVVVSMQLQSSVYTQQQGVLLAAERLGLLVSLKSDTLSAATSPTAVEFEQHRADLRIDAAQFQAVERLLYVGTSTGVSGILSVTSQESDLFVNDGCGNGAVGDVSGGNCTAFSSGVFTVGLHGAMLSFMRQSIGYVDGLRNSFAGSIGGVNAQERVLSAKYAMLEDYADYVDEALTYGLHLRVVYIQTLQSAARAQLDVFTALFIALLILCNFVVYRPLFHQLNQAMKRNRGMLLLFPEDVVHSVTAIASLMKDYAKRSARARR